MTPSLIFILKRADGKLLEVFEPGLSKEAGEAFAEGQDCFVQYVNQAAPREVGNNGYSVPNHRT